MKTWIVWIALFTAVPGTPVVAQSAVVSSDSDTMLVPRGREAYEQHLAELNAKYGADKSGDELKETVLKANEAPSKSQPGPGANRLALPADVAPGEMIRIELLAHGEREFLFQDQVYDESSLTLALGNVQRGYVIDQIVLLADSDNPIQLDHVLELARMGRALSVTTSYQQGNDLKQITAQ